MRQVHCARQTRQGALEVRVAVDPIVHILFFLRQGFGLVRNLTVALHDAERSRHGTSSPERDHGCCRYARIVVWVNTLLRYRGWARCMCLEIPVGLIVGLPDAAE